MKAASKDVIIDTLISRICRGMKFKVHTKAGAA
jgi:hypothetical protein